MKKISAILLMLIAFKAFPQNILDISFGNAGFSVVANTTEIHCFDYDGNGNIINAGYTLQGDASGIYHLTLTKTNSDGILNTNFGANGIVTTTIGHSETPFDLAIQTNGKIIVVGSAYLGPTPNGPGGYIGFAVRYNSDGSIDQTFATNGIFEFSANSHFSSVAILPDNSIILGGNHNSSGVLVKLNSNGLQINTFGSNGVVLLSSASFQFVFWSSILLNDNKLLCFGYDNSDPANSKIAFCKIDDQGNFDTTFGQNGKTVFDLYIDAFNYTEYLYTAKELSNNKILLLGHYMSSVLIKINSDGTFDGTFGTNGILNLSYPSTNLEVQSDGKIILGGNKVISPYNYGYAITRLKSDGTLDSTFNGTGFFDIDVSPENDYLQDIELQGSDKLIIGGSSKLNSVSNFTLARINLNNLSIQDSFSDNSIIIYPNPVANKLFIEDKKGLVEKMIIFDNLGRILKTVTQPNDVQTIFMDFPSGFYHLKLKTKEGKIFTRKIIKK